MGDFFGLFDPTPPEWNPDINLILAVAQWLLQLIVYIAQVLGNFIIQIAQAVFKALSDIAKFLSSWWHDFFKGLWTRLVKILKASQVWNDLRHGHILAFLIDLRKLLDQLYTAFVRPILVMLQRVRIFLQLLRLLHINIAAKLDAYIANLENRINQAFLTIRATVNVLTDIANAIMDPTYLIRKPALLLSIRRQLPALIRVVTGRPAGYYFPSPRGKAGGAFAPVGSNFVLNDPTQNPPASSLLNTNDGIPDPPPLDIGYTISVDAVDSADPLDYFNDDLYPASLCADDSGCWARVLMRNLNVSA